MHVSDIIETHYPTVLDNTDLKTVAELLIQPDITCVVVLNSQKKVVGIVSEYDLIDHSIPSYMKKMEDLGFIDDFQPFYTKLAQLLQQPVTSLMNSPITLKPTSAILEAAFVMITRGFMAIPIVNDDNELLGMVTRNKVITMALQHGLANALSQPT